MRVVPKIRNLLNVVRKKLRGGQYRYAAHAHSRLQQRQVTRLEVKQVLQHGEYEENKDKFEPKYNSWNYSISGKTLDERPLRAVVSFDKKNILIITVIDLNK